MFGELFDISFFQTSMLVAISHKIVAAGDQYFHISQKSTNVHYCFFAILYSILPDFSFDSQAREGVAEVCIFQ